MADSGTRRFSLVTGGGGTTVQDRLAEAGLADVLTLQRQAFEGSTPADERTLFQDTLAEYCWARDVAGLSAKTLQILVQPVLEICSFYDVMPWRLTPRDLDRYFAGPGKPGRHSTMRSKLNRIDGYFAFLEQRYAGEILRRFGAAVESPVDAFNRPRHRGDFGLRIPPSARATKEFFASWREALPTSRKYPVAVRNYVMSKLRIWHNFRDRVAVSDIGWAGSEDRSEHACCRMSTELLTNESQSARSLAS